MATYLAFGTHVSDALQSLLETTGAKVEPAVAFTSCAGASHEHFVPTASLQKHLRKCHGERGARPIHNATFYYGRQEGEDVVAGGGDSAAGVDEKEDSEGLRSLLESADSESVADKKHELGVVAAIRRTATSVGGFYQQVQAWQRVPRAFASITDSERELVTSSSLRRWLNAECSRLVSDEPLDEELVDYVAGLLDHPDFCQPDLLVLELHEFLGNGVADFVLSLWKFLIVEIGLHSVFQTEKGDIEIMQLSSDRKNIEPVISSTTTDTLQPQPSDDNLIDDRDYRRRRTSYRGKVGTKSGPAAFREMIQKHMIGFSLELDRELVHGGGFEEESAEGNQLRKVPGSRPEPSNWRRYTDALEVRNRNRPGRKDQPARPRPRSKSRERSNMRDRFSGYCNRRKRGPSPDRKGRGSPNRHYRRSRSRSPLRYHDSRPHSSSRRSRHSSPDRDRNGSRRDRHREDYRR